MTASRRHEPVEHAQRGAQLPGNEPVEKRWVPESTVGSWIKSCAKPGRSISCL